MLEAPLLVVAWDGACFELTQPLIASGRMPVLGSLLRQGKAWRVQSTNPAVTFPAWTSFLTGARPDHHGITDFTIPRDDGYGVRFVNASHRALPTLVARMADAGLRVGMYGFPATFPPEGRGVFEICGFDTPLGSSAASRATHPRELAAALRSRYGRLGIEGAAQSRIDPAWHERTRGQLLGDIGLRTRIALDLWDEQRPDVFLLHFMESDTVSHHYWQFFDSSSPLHRAGPHEAIADVYAALDQSLGELLAAVGPQANVLLLSDHGSAGASDRVLFWNRWLADQGWLTFQEHAGEPWAVRIKRLALRGLPASFQARAFALAGGLADRLESGSRFAGIDWGRTRAFSDEVPYFPSIRLNIVGREKSGVVEPEQRDEVLRQLTEQLLASRDPADGQPVVERVRRREEIFDGPFCSRYPDLLLELRRPGGYAYGAGSSRGGREKGWTRRLRPAEVTGAKGSGTSGVHGEWGMAVLREPGPEEPIPTTGADLSAAVDSPADCSLEDLTVTVLALAGVAPSRAMRGRPLSRSVPAASVDGVAPGAQKEPAVVGASRDYSEQEAREVEERLRALGYLP